MMPEMMEIVADELGLDAAIKLADTLGGMELSIPYLDSEASVLSEKVGPEIASVLIKNYGGDQTFIPSWKSRESDMRKKLILESEGSSANDLVAITGLSVRQIRRIRAEGRKQKRGNIRTTMDRVQRQ